MTVLACIVNIATNGSPHSIVANAACVNDAEGTAYTISASAAGVNRKMRGVALIVIITAVVSNRVGIAIVAKNAVIARLQQSATILAETILKRSLLSRRILPSLISVLS